jgi:hypothetical protein
MTAPCWQKLGGSVTAASAAVAGARSAAAVHSARAAAWWQQRGGCGGFTGTVRKCADPHAFKRQQRAKVHVFVIGQGWRDNSADGIVAVGSNGGARGDVHRGSQCAAAANNDAAAANTADVDADGDGNNIVC